MVSMVPILRVLLPYICKIISDKKRDTAQKNKARSITQAGGYLPTIIMDARLANTS